LPLDDPARRSSVRPRSEIEASRSEKKALLMGGKSSKPGGIITWVAADHNQAGRAVEKLSSPEMSTVMDGLDPPIYPHSKVSSVTKYMARRRGPPSQGWKTFLRNQADGIVAMDLFVVPIIIGLAFAVTGVGNRVDGEGGQGPQRKVAYFVQPGGSGKQAISW